MKTSIIAAITLLALLSPSFSAPSEGTLVKGPRANVYIMESGKKRFIPGGIDGTTFRYNKFDSNEIRQLTEEDLDAIPDGPRIPEVITRDLQVEANSGSALQVMRELPIPAGWIYLSHIEKVTRGGNKMEGDGSHSTITVEGPMGPGSDAAGSQTRRIEKLQTTVTVAKNYGSKRNNYRVVVTAYLQKEEPRS